MPQQKGNGRLLGWKAVANRLCLIMKNTSRDLLVLFKEDVMSPQAVEQEVGWLHDLLFQVERLDNFVHAHELIDINRYKIVSKPTEIKKAIRQGIMRPFLFLNNKN